MQQNVGALAALLLTSGLSCQIAPIVMFYNHSLENLILRVLDEQHGLPSLDAIEIAYPYAANGGFTLSGNGCERSYRPPPPPAREFTRYRGVREHITVQLEPDGSIFVLRPDQKPPIDVKPVDQPPEFPLHPASTVGCS